MSSHAKRIIIKLIQLILCTSCLITKKLTDTQSQRLFVQNQKISSEWRLLNNLAWSQESNDFSIITFGGYTFLTAVFLTSRFIERSLRYSVCEKLLLLFGVIFFIVQVCLTLASLEYIPMNIIPNAYLLSGLSLLAALCFLIDLLAFQKQDRKGISKSSQTELLDTIIESATRNKFSRLDQSNDASEKRPEAFISTKKIYLCPQKPINYMSNDNLRRNNVISKNPKYLNTDV